MIAIGEVFSMRRTHKHVKIETFQCEITFICHLKRKEKLGMLLTRLHTRHVFTIRSPTSN